MTSSVQVSLDDDLAALVAARSADTGRPQDEVIAWALRRGLGGGRLTQILDRGRQDSTLSEDEAMELAISEQKAVRASRQTS